MTERTILLYLLIIVLGAIVSSGGVMQAQLNAGQEVNWTAVLAALVGTLITGISSTLLPSLRKAAELTLETVDSNRERLESLYFPVIHRECGKTGAYAIVPPTPVESLSLAKLIGLDRKFLSRLVCGACGNELVSFREYHGQWLATSLE